MCDSCNCSLKKENEPFTTCNSCDQNFKGLELDQNTKECKCSQQKYFNQEKSECQDCQQICNTCLNEFSCKTCKTEYNLNLVPGDNGVCECSSGYYFSTSESLCKQCGKLCQSCDEEKANQNKCDICKTGKNLTKNSDDFCVCSSTNYYIYNNEECQECKITCSKCSQANNADAGKCDECDTNLGLSRIPTNGICQCLNIRQYFNDNNRQCQSCDEKCEKCFNNSDQCTSCRTNGNLSFQSGLCFCQDNSYWNGASLQCLQCHQSCKTCSGKEDNECTDCDTNIYKPLNSSNMCKCKDDRQYYNSQSGQCEKCDLTCLTCHGGNQNQCDNCSSSFNKQDGACKCKTITGLTKYFNYQQEKCVSCHQTCLTCSGPSQNECKTCNLDKFTQIVNTCKCTIGQWSDIRSTCITCHETCLTCASTTQYQCLTCDSQKQLTGPTSSGVPTSPGECKCTEGRYYDFNTGSCEKCHIKCLTCYIAGESGCLSCDTNKKLEGPKDDQCICSGPNYWKTDKCTSCDLTCKKCSGSNKNECTECQAPALKLANLNTCICRNDNQYFDYGSSKCENCDKSCKTCYGLKKNQCDSCEASIMSQDGNICYCTDSRKYFDYNTSTCKECHKTCFTCSGENIDDCLSCNSAKFNYENGTCACKSGKWNDSLSLCVDCHPTCKVCNGPADNNCQDCDQNVGLFGPNNQNECKCNSDKYYDAVSVTCKPCHLTCLTCDGNSSQNCLACDLNKFNAPNPQKECKCKISNYYYNTSQFICVPCDIKCLTCSELTGATLNKCDTCDQSKQLKKDINNYCVCKSSNQFFDPSELKCKQCQQYCLTCINFQTCDQCDDSQADQIDSKCYKKCQRTQFRNSDKDCEECDTYEKHCIECLSSYVCLKCNNKAYLDSNQCIANCPVGEYMESSNYECKSCQNHCLECENKTTCLKCDLELSTQQNDQCVEKDSSCKTDQWKNGSSCEDCSLNCLTCTSSTLCIHCDPAKSYLENGICKLEATQPDEFIKNQKSEPCNKYEQYCQKCSDQFICLQCDKNYAKLLRGQCVQNQCKVDEFMNIFKKKCERCVIYEEHCLRCTEQYVCTECDEKYSFLKGNQCIQYCPNGKYYDKNSQQCNPCRENCLKCLTQNKCVECDLSRSDLNGEQCVPNPLSQFKNPLNPNELLNCSENCLTCYDQDNCTVCDPIKSVLRNKKCEPVSYSDGQFPNQVTGQVENCDIYEKHCLKCSDQFTCLKCDSKYAVLEGNQCIEWKCSDDSYWNEYHLQCQSCSIYEQYCTKCKDSYTCTECDRDYAVLQDNQCIPHCKKGQYKNVGQNSCLDCPKYCLNCQNPYSCEQCDLEFSYQEIDKCIARNCLPRQYLNVQTNQCEDCIDNCLSCEDGGNTCTYCDPYKAYQTSDCQTPDNAIKPGEFLNQIIKQKENCKSYEQYCLECKDQYTCKKCDKNYSKLVGDQCIETSCPTTHFFKINKCESCEIYEQHCLECTEQYKCTTCKSEYAILKKGQCVERCPEREYFDTSSSSCQPCLSHCLQCKDQSTCDQCDLEVTNKDGNTCKPKNCVKGQFQPLNESTCKNCRPNCITCTDYSKCILCNKVSILKNNDCLELICPDGQFLNKVSGECEDCNIYEKHCQQCIDQFNCTRCDVFYAKLERGQCIICGDGEYIDQTTQDCKPCHKNCLKCINQETCDLCDESVGAIIQDRKCVIERLLLFNTTVESYDDDFIKVKLNFTEPALLDSSQDIANQMKINILDYGDKLYMIYAQRDIEKTYTEFLRISIANKVNINDIQNLKVTFDDDTLLSSASGLKLGKWIDFAEIPIFEPFKEDRLYMGWFLKLLLGAFLIGTIALAAVLGVSSFFAVTGAIQMISFLLYYDIDYPHVLNEFLRVFQWFNFVEGINLMDLFDLPEDNQIIQKVRFEQKSSQFIKLAGGYLTVLGILMGIYGILKLIGHFYSPAVKKFVSKYLDWGYFAVIAFIGYLVLNFALFVQLMQESVVGKSLLFLGIMIPVSLWVFFAPTIMSIINYLVVPGSKLSLFLLGFSSQYFFVPTLLYLRSLLFIFGMVALHEEPMIGVISSIVMSMGLMLLYIIFSPQFNLFSKARDLFQEAMLVLIDLTLIKIYKEDDILQQEEKHWWGVVACILIIILLLFHAAMILVALLFPYCKGEKQLPLQKKKIQPINPDQLQTGTNLKSAAPPGLGADSGYAGASGFSGVGVTEPNEISQSQVQPLNRMPNPHSQTLHQQVLMNNQSSIPQIPNLNSEQNLGLGLSALQNPSDKPLEPLFFKDLHKKQLLEEAMKNKKKKEDIFERRKHEIRNGGTLNQGNSISNQGAIKTISKMKNF